MEINGYHEGYYVLVENSAPKIVHVHFHQMIGYVEFLNKVLGPECTIVNKSQCDRLSTFMGLWIESYSFNEKTIYFTENLFSAYEVDIFVRVYNDDNFEGLRPSLATRQNIHLQDYIRGLIHLALTTTAPVNGRLQIDFSHKGPQCLPFLHQARMYYTRPKPGNFNRIDIDENTLSIFFYTE